MTLGMRFATGTLRLLLWLCPRWFRRAHGEEMEQWFASRLAQASGPRAVVRLWTRAAADTIHAAVVLRRRAIPEASIAKPGGLDMFAQDIRFAVRHLSRTPVFALGAIALLAVGIGANVAVFTVVDRMLLRGLPYERPHEVVQIYQGADDGTPSRTAFPAYRDIAATSGLFTAVAATSVANASWERPDTTESVTIEFTTASYLDVIGLPVQRGRWFAPEADAVGHPPEAVVSAAAWRARFGGAPDVVGQVIRLNGQPVTIVGIGPDALAGSYAPVITDFWLSISANVIGGQVRVANLDRREDHWYDVRARLTAGTSVAAAGAALHALAVRMGELYPDVDRGRDITLRPASEVNLFADAAGGLWAVTAIVATLLLLAGANLANLLLVRGVARTGEVAVRRALGAGTWRVARLYLIESLVLSVVGGLAGLVLARSLLAGLQSAPLPPPFSVGLDLGLDLRIALFAAGLMTLSGLLFGLAPAVRSIRSDVTRALRDASRTTSVGRGTARLRDGFVVLQVAGSLVLVLAAVLLGRSLVHMQSVDPGVDADRVAFIRTTFARTGLPQEQMGAALEDLRSAAEALPGVTRAAAASRLPAQRAGTTTTIVEDYVPAAGTDAVELSFTVVTPDYFDTVGLRVVEGRGFAATDVMGADRVVLISRSAAQQFWGGVRPVGRRLRSQGQPNVFRTVVGVVEDAPVVTFPEVDAPPMFYIPAGQAVLGAAYVLVRTEGDPAALAGPLRELLSGTGTGLPVLSQGTLATHFGAALVVPMLMVRVMVVVTALALVLAALGIYSVVAFNVARRANELGLRIALGASRGRVVGLVLRHVGTTVGVGLALGLLLAAAVVGRLESALFGITAFDPPTFVGAGLIMALVAGLAAYGPARRAARTDPAQTLRSV